MADMVIQLPEVRTILLKKKTVIIWTESWTSVPKCDIIVLCK